MDGGFLSDHYHLTTFLKEVEDYVNTYIHPLVAFERYFRGQKETPEAWEVIKAFLTQLEVERKRIANSSSGTIGTSVTMLERADSMIQMMRVTRSFVLHNTNKNGGLTEEKPICLKSKMSKAEDAKV